MSFSVLLIFLPTICLSVPALVPFDFVNDVVSQTGTGTVVIGISYLGPPGPGQVNVIEGQDKSTIAVDLLYAGGPRVFIGAGKFGRTWFLPNITLTTEVDKTTGVETCGFVHLGSAFEIKSLRLLNDKGTAYVRQTDDAHSNKRYPVTLFNGYGTDNTQCNTSISYQWMVDDGSQSESDWGLVRRIHADTPLDVPQFGSVVTTVVKQYYEYGAFALGTPNSSLFDIPDICNATNAFDWCATFFSRGLITLYDNPVLGAS